jgi:hypothetical protein
MPLRSAWKFVIGFVALIIIGAVALLWLATPGSLPVKLSLVWFRNEGTNGPEAIIHFTNDSNTTFGWDLRTFVFADGQWRHADRQPLINYPSATLRSHQSWNHAVPVPEGARRWKVELRCQRRDTRLENIVEDVFKRAGLRSPFGSDSRRQVLTTELEFER